tara:strand:- start:22575 stop:23051 length:477 start_codon:yes stop_codon:yes gene_type:complete
MTFGQRLTSSRLRLLLSSGVSLLLLTGIGTLWNNLKSSAELDGRYNSSGQMQLSNGQVIETSHNMRLGNGRFYAVTKQGDTILETSGSVEYGFLGRYRLIVEKGGLIELSTKSDEELMFNLLYGHQPGSIIHLVPFQQCLYGLETRQAYCQISSAKTL